MKNLCFKLTLCSLFLIVPLKASETQTLDARVIQAGGRTYSLYPHTYRECPDLPSPFVSGDNEEFLISLTGNEFTIIPVTVENGEPFDYVGGNFSNKGRQLGVDKNDFPVLAETGLHSKKELEGTLSITGRPVSEINRLGHPGILSSSGFMGEDEDIISLMQKDNRIVSALGLTHPRLSRPLFQIFNIILARMNLSVTVFPENKVLYNRNWISVQYRGGKGWQESIFDDEILGFWQIEIRRDFTPEENVFFEAKFQALNEQERSALKERLSHIRTGEMLPFYIQRYGFYEGSTPYRVDPIAISFIFGLKSLEEIERIFGRNLFGVTKKADKAY